MKRQLTALVLFQGRLTDSHFTLIPLSYTQSLFAPLPTRRITLSTLLFCWGQVIEYDWASVLEEEFKQALAQAGPKLLVIDFTAIWCGACQDIKPAYKALAEAYPEAIFYEIDVDEAQDVAEHCWIRQMPTFHLYRNNQKVCQVTCADMSLLETKIKESCK
uniref:thioredoxin-like n=1 Tax=Myxine glutinosa TaxID=7769 RepID=UPI00358F669C